MDTLLIAHPSEDLCDALEHKLCAQYGITICSDGQEALACLLAKSFDALILSLELPNLDGLSILQQAGSHLPEAVLSMTLTSSSYTFQQAVLLGSSHVLLSPCPVDAIARHLSMIREHLRNPNAQTLTPQLRIARYLRLLNIPNHRPGFQQLLVSIFLYAQDPAQSLSKELYPACAQICGKDNVGQVSKSIERIIKEAWEIRDDLAWQEVFPRKANSEPKCPSNQVFISTLAKKLIQELAESI